MKGSSNRYNNKATHYHYLGGCIWVVVSLTRTSVYIDVAEGNLQCSLVTDTAVIVKLRRITLHQQLQRCVIACPFILDANTPRLNGSVSQIVQV